MPSSFTYGEVEDALLALGFQKTEEFGRRIRFLHPRSPVITLLPFYERAAIMRPLDCHFVRDDLINFGFIDNPDQFEEIIRNRGRVAS